MDNDLNDTIVINSPLPLFPDSYIVIPERWKGKHYLLYQKALAATIEKELKGILQRFSISLALAEDWNIEGLNGPVKNWDFREIDLELMLWVNQTVLANFEECFKVKKKNLKQFGNNSIMNMVQDLQS